MKIPYPDGIRGAASRFGCELPTHADLSRFGFEIGTPGSVKINRDGTLGVVGSTTTAPAPISTASAPTPATAPISSRIATTSAFTAVPVKGVVKERPVVMSIPLKIDPNVSLAVADKLLGDPNVKNAKQVVANTISLAKIPREKIVATGLPPAYVDGISRAAAIIDAAQQIREATGATSGQAAIPVSWQMAPAVASAGAASAYTLSDGDISALEEYLPPPHENLWQRFFHWLASWAD